MPTYPGDTPVSLKTVKTTEIDTYTTYELTSSLHAGTHIDAPLHLVPNGCSIAGLPLGCFVGNGVLLDVRGENPIKTKPQYHDKINPNDIVILFTGFDKHYGTDKYYTHHPVVAPELADFLISKKIRMLGFDTPSPDNPPFNVHKALLKNNIYLLENLTNLNNLLNVNNFEVIALPLKITAEASFVRAICRIGE
jgi:kynurenine formamidase